MANLTKNFFNFENLAFTANFIQTSITESELKRVSEYEHAFDTNLKLTIVLNKPADKYTFFLDHEDEAHLAEPIYDIANDENTVKNAFICELQKKAEELTHIKETVDTVIKTVKSC